MEIDEGAATVDVHVNDEGMEAYSVGPWSLDGLGHWMASVIGWPRSLDGLGH